MVPPCLALTSSGLLPLVCLGPGTQKEVRSRTLRSKGATGLTLVRQAVFGVGDEIVHPYIAPR